MHTSPASVRLRHVGKVATLCVMEILGIRILGFSSAGLRKLALTALVLTVAFGARRALRFVAGFGSGASSRRSIWIRKLARLVMGGLACLLLLSIWFDDPARLATFMGLVGAGLAFAMQQAVLSMAGFFVIVFGKIFDLGHRIEMGGVRGDVLDIGLFKTTVMEMGVPHSLFPEPHHWVAARQYTGRVVTIANAAVFKQPIYNYTANFDLLWEEIRVPVRYGADLAIADRVVLAAARRHTGAVVDGARSQLRRMRERFLVEDEDLEPRLYLRLTDNWMELTVRFLVSTHGVREIKDAIFREIHEKFERLGIEIASTTFEVTHAPPLGLHVATGEVGEQRRAPPDIGSH